MERREFKRQRDEERIESERTKVELLKIFIRKFVKQY